MKWIAALTISLILASWSTDAHALSPVKDCPEGLVCLTEAEAKAIAKKRAALEHELSKLQGRKPKKVGALYNFGAMYTPSLDNPVGLTACGGFYAGPFAFCAGVYNDDANVGLYYTKRF